MVVTWCKWHNIYGQGEQNYLYMKLPKIQEDEYPLKNIYFTTITEKPIKKYKSDKLIFDWVTAEVQLIPRIPDEQEILQALIQLQSTCKKMQVPHFYSYFFVSSVLFELEKIEKEGPALKRPNLQSKSPIIQRIKTESHDLLNKKSKWNKIVQLILLRQNLVSKINQEVANNKLQQVYTHIDDIRFVNFEIIKKIGEWKESNMTQSDIHPFFLHEGSNYLIKMINDNVDVISVLNSKAVKFLSPPNPFYLSRDGNKANMSQTQQSEIDNSMEVLAKAKAQELRMMINPPKFVTEAKNEEAELKKLKSQLQNQKMERIKNAYKTNSFYSPSATLRSSKYGSEKSKQVPQNIKQVGLSSDKMTKTPAQKGVISNHVDNGLNQRNRLEKMIQEKEVAVINDLKNSQARLNKITKSNSRDKVPTDKKEGNKYLSKVELLKKSVEQNQKFNVNSKLQVLGAQNDKIDTAQSKGQNLMRLSTMSKKKIPQTVAQIKAPKPKIRLVMEKQSFVEEVVKSFLPPQNLEMYKSLNVRKSASSFYKPSEKAKVEEKQQQENNIDIKPVTQYSRSLSASQLTQKQFLKSNSKVKNILSIYGNKKKNKSKSRSISQDSWLSLSKSPKKRFPAEPKEEQRKEEQRKEEQRNEDQSNNPDASLRIVNSKLRELTIMSIYGKKSQSNSKSFNPYESSLNIEGKKKTGRQKEKDKIDQQLLEVKSRLKELGKTSIYDRNLSTKGFEAKKEAKQSMLAEKELAIKKSNKLTQQQIGKRQKEKQQLIESLQKKDQRIEELMKQLKKEEDTEQKSNQVDQQNLRAQRAQKIKQIEAVKEKIRSENKLIKEQMEEEEKKYIELKQKQYQMKQEAMIKKYEMDMQQMKQEYIRKNKELETKIMQEEKIRKEQEIKLLKEHREMEQLKMQMEEKKLKQELLQQILREHQLKTQQQEQLNVENQEKKAEKLKKQLLEKEEMERKILQNFEEDNRKLVEMFESIKRKNEEAEKENQRKMTEIKRIEQLAKKEQQELRRLQAELLEARNLLQIEQNKSNHDNEEVAQVNQVEDIELVKLRVKEEILKEIMVRRKEEQSQERLQKQERAKRLAEIEQQIRNQLKRQEEQMQRIEKEEREKYQRMKRQLEEEHRKKMQLLEENSAEQKKSIDDKKNQQKNNEEYKVSQQQYEKELRKAVELSKQKEVESEQQLQKKNSQEAIQSSLVEQVKIKNEDINKNISQQKGEIEDLNKSIEKNKGMPIQDQKKQETAQKKIQKSQNQLNKDNSLKSEIKTEKTPAQEQTQVKKQTQTVKQPTDEILNKYQNLQQHLAKCKQIFIDDKEFPQFLNNFYAQLAPEVKEMMPYSSAQILKLSSSLHRKIDIFQGPSGQSIGWVESEKYILLGQISCVENIIKKYGQVQIEITYIFNKTNLYQKQFLAKQVKIFDKIGFIFQKKLKEDNMYSIKLIIKVPLQILPKGFKPPSNQLKISSKIRIDLLKTSEQKQENQKYSYSYLLSQTLKNCLNSQQNIQFVQDVSEEARMIKNKMNYKLYNDSIFKSEEIDDKKLNWEMSIPLKYIQTHDYCCYLMKGSQFFNPTTKAQKIFVIPVNTNLSMVAFAYDQSCKGSSLDALLMTKTNNLEEERQLTLCLPIWSKKEDIRLNYPGPKQFQFSYWVQANLNFGSIINTSVFKDQYRLLEPPFVFSLFQTNDKGLLLRQLSGEVVEHRNLIINRR